MSKEQSELYHNRESTRHFLFSKAEAENLASKRVHIPAGIQKAIQSVYPGLPTGRSFLHHAIEQLSSAKIFACMVFQIDDDAGCDPGQTQSDPAAAHKKTAKLLADWCRQHKGTWGLLNSGLLSAFIEGKNGLQCLKLVQRFQKTHQKQTGKSVSAGIAEYPAPGYQPAEILTNALKALEHAAFFGSGSSAIFDAVSLNISADQLFDKGDITGSIEEFQRALQLDPSNLNVHNSLGVCYGLVGDYQKATLEFKAAIELGTDEVMPWYNLGFIQILAGNREKALDLFLKASTINQGVFEVAFQTGRLLLEMDQPESARKFLEHASRLEPESGVVFRYLGECYAHSGDAEAAIGAYKKAIKRNPSDAASLSAMGCLFDEQGENPEIALMFCRESVQLSPENGSFRYRLGQLYFKHNRLDDALKEFKKADLLGQDASEFISKIQNQLSAKAL